MRKSSVGATTSLVPPEVRAPARVVPETLPRIYVYDHCPFCVRVRLALGLKNIKHEVRGGKLADEGWQEFLNISAGQPESHVIFFLH